jgi:hypothetical protein
MPGQMRYVFGDINSGQVIEELSLQSVTLDNKLNDWGTFRCSFKLDQTGKSNIDLVNATIPGKCYVVAERDDVPVWDGIVWSRTYQSQAKDVELTARTWPAYADKITFDADFLRTSTEQRNIFIDLWNTMQAQSGVYSGIIVPSYYPNVILKDLTANQSEYKTFFSQMQSLADTDNGFDWTIATSRASDGRYNRQLVIGYPVLGSQDGANTTFDYPGPITNYYQSESMTDAGTNFYGIGAGEGDTMLVSTLINQDMLNSGFPRYDEVMSFKDTTALTNLVGLTAQAAVQRRAPLTTVKVFTLGDTEPVFGSYGLGDTITAAFKDPRHPNGFQTAARMVAFSFTPASDDSAETVEVIFEGDELNDSGGG